MKLTQKQLEELGNQLSGTADSIQSGLQAIGLDIDDYDATNVEDQLLDLNMEICPGCGWWAESSELVDDDGEETSCDNCR